MAETYIVKYRAPGQKMWNTVKDVIEDGMTDRFRWLRLSDDSLLHFPMDSEVILTAERMKVIEKAMSRQVGAPVQMVNV